MRAVVDVKWSRLAWLRLPVALALALLSFPLAPAPAARAAGWWAQALRAATFWSGPDGAATGFGDLPKGSYLFVVDPQPFPGRGRLFVQESAGGNYGYVDAIALAPSGPPAPDGAPAPAAAAPPADPGAVPPPPPDGSAAPAPSLVASPVFQTYWVATDQATSLWASPGPGGEPAGDVAQGAKLLVLAPPAGGRLYVQDARAERLGYVDAAVVGPSGAPGPADLQPATAPAPTAPPASAFKPWWVSAFRSTDLWSSLSGGTNLGQAARGDSFLVMNPQDGPRLYVLNPKTKTYAYVDASSVGPTDGPLGASFDVKGWQGVVAGDVVNLRTEPHTLTAPAGQVRGGDQVTVSGWVEGEELDKDSRMWARVTAVRRKGPDGQWADVPLGVPPGPRYLYSGLLRPLQPTQAPPPPQTSLGAGGAHWIDANLTQQVVTAYEGDKAVFIAPTTSGRPGWETPTGIFRIQRRVENETMIGSTLLRLDTMESPDYKLENVKWTQYFTSGGAAIHTNYWRPVSLFGMPSSHGCLGMIEQNAKWFWSWAKIGTPLLVHA